MSKKTVVTGVSTNPERYSYKAVQSLLEHKHEVVPLGIKDGELFGLHISTDMPRIDNVHTVSMYVGKKNQDTLIPYIISLKPQRVIFNPGTENEDFELLLAQHGIAYLRACTLVLLSIEEY